jgi:hypothetical protein
MEALLSESLSPGSGAGMWINLKIELCCSLLHYGIECHVLFSFISFFIACVHRSSAEAMNDPSNFLSP